MHNRREYTVATCAKRFFPKVLRYRYFFLRCFSLVYYPNIDTLPHIQCLQGTVIDLRNPGMFSIHWQSEEMMESLKKITQQLQKTYNSSFVQEYKPEVGELCAVKFSLDQVRLIILNKIRDYSFVKCMVLNH